MELKPLYHGTDKNFTTFDFKKAKGHKDFGKGYYLTTNLNQAKRWAQGKAERNNKKTCYVYTYLFDTSELAKWKVLRLLKYDCTWLDFIVASRIDDAETDYDIIFDRMADNKGEYLPDVLNSYSKGELTACQVIDFIKFENNDADQYCIKNKNALTILKEPDKYVFKKKDGLWRKV